MLKCDESKEKDDINVSNDNENVDKNESPQENIVEEELADIEKLKNDNEGLKNQIEKKNNEISEIKEMMLRRQADFENFKKRMLKNAEQDKKLSIKDIAVDIIEINDNLLRASEAAENIPEGASLEEVHNSYVEGVLMISKSIEAMLEKYGIEEIESSDVEFDPNVHEAVEINMSDEVDEDLVTKVYQKGFKFEEFVIRSAKVCVTKPQPKTDNENSEKE